MIPVVAAVVILAMAIGIVAGLTLNGRSGAGTAAPAAGYVPADATIYYELRLDLPGDQRANFETLLGHFPSDAATTLLTSRLDQLLDGGASPQPSAFSYSTDIKPWFDGAIAAAMVGYPSVNPAGTVSEMPHMLFFMGVTDEAAASAAMDALRTESGLTGVTSTTHDGATIWSTTAPADQTGGMAVSVAWTVTSDEVIVGTSPDLVASALDVHAGSAPSLASRQEFRDGLARLPTYRVGTFSIDTAPILDSLRSTLASAMPSASPLADALASIGSQFLVGSARIEGDRLVFDETGRLPSGVSLANRDSGLAASAPADALYYQEVHDVGASLSQSIDLLSQTLGSTAGGSQIDQLSSILGGDLTSFVSWIGDAAVVAGESGSSPYVGLIITPTDAQAASTRLLQLQGLLQLAIGGSGGPSISVSTADHNGTTITTLTIGGVPADAAWAGTIQYAVTNSRVVIGTGTSFVANVLDMTEANSLAGQARFQDAVNAVGGSQNTDLVWVDLAGIRVALEAALPASAQTTYQSQVAPWVTPFDYIAAAGKVDSGWLDTHGVLVVK